MLSNRDPESQEKGIIEIQPHDMVEGGEWGVVSKDGNGEAERVRRERAELVMVTLARLKLLLSPGKGAHE